MSALTPWSRAGTSPPIDMTSGIRWGGRHGWAQAEDVIFGSRLMTMTRAAGLTGRAESLVSLREPIWVGEISATSRDYEQLLVVPLLETMLQHRPVILVE